MNRFNIRGHIWSGSGLVLHTICTNNECSLARPRQLLIKLTCDDGVWKMTVMKESGHCLILYSGGKRSCNNSAERTPMPMLALMIKYLLRCLHGMWLRSAKVMPPSDNMQTIKLPILQSRFQGKQSLSISPSATPCQFVHRIFLKFILYTHAISQLNDFGQ